MANTPNVTVDMSELRKLQREHPRKVNAMLEKLARDMEGDVKMSFDNVSPSSTFLGVDTGHLKRSIETQAITGGWAVTSQATADGFEYDTHWEFGTDRTPARPFMAPAFHRTVARMPRNLLKNTVEK